MRKELLKLQFHNAMTGWWRAESVWQQANSCIWSNDFIVNSRFTTLFAVPTLNISELTISPTFPALHIRNASSECSNPPIWYRLHIVNNCHKRNFFPILSIYCWMLPRAIFRNELTAIEVERNGKELFIIHIVHSMRKTTSIRVCVCVNAIAIHIEAKSKMTKMSLWTTFEKCMRCIVECSTADVRLIRFGIMLAGNRALSHWQQCRRFLSSEPIPAQTYITNQLYFSLALAFVRILWMLSALQPDDRKYEDGACLILLLCLVFLSMARSDLWPSPFLALISPVTVRLTAMRLHILPFEVKPFVFRKKKKKLKIYGMRFLRVSFCARSNKR